MPRAASYGRMWSTRRGSSSTAPGDEEDHPLPERDMFSSDLSELESESEYNPDNEDGEKHKNVLRHIRFEVGSNGCAVVTVVETVADIFSQLNETVWVKPKGCFEWFRGSVKKIRESPSSRGSKVCSRTGPNHAAGGTSDEQAQKRGAQYVVVFRRHNTNMRDIFSLTEGTIKADTPRVRALVRMAS